jgi:hypothetical protein
MKEERPARSAKSLPSSDNQGVAGLSPARGANHSEWFCSASRKSVRCWCCYSQRARHNSVWVGDLVDGFIRCRAAAAVASCDAPLYEIGELGRLVARIDQSMAAAARHSERYFV